jgi:CheY-like chemotaxis protein
MVDDEPALMDIFQQVMRRLNYDIRTCNSAREAIALFQQQPGHFDLVITDMTMPEMNGLEVARQIHALRPTVPIILATGHTANLSEEDLRGTGIRELLIKPISVPSLAELVHRLLAKPA